MRCPSDDELSVYLEGSGSNETRDRIRTHAEGCASCRAAIAAFLQAFDDDDDALPASSVPSSALPRGTRVGRYVVDERLGAGGMGVVYAARDVVLARRVALKLLGGRATARRRKSRANVEQTVAAQARLQREAQMMAKLGHPNVVAVYEVGEVGDEVFVAMELVDGVTLRKWLADEKRSVRAILDAFVQVGRGLSAAHEAGIVHRDIKPENVLVGRDGRVRITDFGLAEGKAGPETSIDVEHAMDIAAETSMKTRVGLLVGTPAYMAPEQLEGHAADERSDQFSFAVMLWEALHGERPYAGATPREILASMRARALRPPKRRMPSAVRKALKRALDPDRAQRFDSMEPLVRAISPRLLRARDLAAVAVLLVAVASFATRMASRRTQAPESPCHSGEDPLAGVWDGAARSRLSDHARAVAPALADDVLARTLPTLDAFGASYRAMRISTCEATRIRGEQSEAMLDLRMACLDRRKQELAALVEVMTNGDPSTLALAPRAALAIAPLSTCADASALSGPVAPQPAVRDAVAAVRADLARAEAAWLAGRFTDGLRIASAAVIAAGPTNHRPVQAEALFMRARLEEATGQFTAERDTLLDAISRAEAGKHDALAVEIWAALTRISGAKLDKPDDARAYEARARAALERAGDPAAGHVAVALAVASGRRTKGEYAQAVAVLEEGLKALEGHDLVVQQVELLAELARAQRELGTYDAAQATVEKALTIAQARFGPNHPDVATLYEIGAMIASRRGDHAAAVAGFERVAKLREAVLGDKHPDVAQARVNQATALTRAGRPKEAVPLLESALAIMIATYGDSHPNIASVENNLGFAHLRMNEYAAARPHFERAIAIGEKSLGEKHPTLAIWLGNLARVEMGEGQPKKAIDLLVRALAIEEASLGPKHVDLGFNLTSLGQAHLALGHEAEAISLLERAVTLREAGGAAKEKLAESRFALARALVHKDRARAKKLAVQAEEAFAAAGPAATKDLAEVRGFVGGL